MRRAAVKNLANKTALELIANNDPDFRVRNAAKETYVKNLTDQSQLAYYAKNGSVYGERIAAIKI